MEDRNRDKQNPADAFDDNQDKRKPLTNENEDQKVNDVTGGLMDLDGDGFIGNTGGFYGGTSYLGSNYGEDWNKETNNRVDDNAPQEGNFGAAGQQDATDNVWHKGDNSGHNRTHLTDEDRVI